ncbi:TPA_exp: hypothetical protein A8136_2428 [Trichophyton benhamiae CBS 112371]|nr:TPA_exp: hypothetical protein A8136_2428 [Trichophyton benhamiae CBS 112371]
MITEEQANQLYHEPKIGSFEAPNVHDHNTGHTSSAVSSTESSPQLRQGEWRPQHKSRQYSFDAQEQKHKLQSRLTGLVKGKETGFTEREGH